MQSRVLHASITWYVNFQKIREKKKKYVNLSYDIIIFQYKISIAGGMYIMNVDDVAQY